MFHKISALYHNKLSKTQPKQCESGVAGVSLQHYGPRIKEAFILLKPPLVRSVHLTFTEYVYGR